MQHQVYYPMHMQQQQHMQQPMYPAYNGYGYQSSPPRKPYRGNKNHKKHGKGGNRSGRKYNTREMEMLAYNRYFTKEVRNQYVALDCEMVGVGEHGQHSELARVTLLDWHGRPLYDQLVRPQHEVTDYRTFVSGITPEMLEGDNTLDFETAREEVMIMLQGKILVGHGLKNDLAVLSITHPWYKIRDTAKYEPFMKVHSDGCLWPRGLRDLAADVLGQQIQVAGRAHDPKEDAMTALRLYKHVWSQWEQSTAYKMQRAAWAHTSQYYAGPAAGGGSSM